MIKLIAIKVKDGVYVSDCESTNYSQIRKYLFDGVVGQQTYRTDWVLIKDIPSKVELPHIETRENVRYELREGYPVNNATPKVINSFDKEDYENVIGLYDYKYDMVESFIENIEFELNIIDSLDDFKIERKQYEFSTSLLDQLMYHPVVQETRPCKMSLRQSYQIIRNYVKENINGKYARVTSDYDFHFEVKKVIRLDKPESYQINVNILNSRKKPKYETRYRKERDVVAFNTYHDSMGSKYGGELVKAFEGDNYDDMIEKMNGYLFNLMLEINKPLVDCPHCHGLGVVNE